MKMTKNRSGSKGHNHQRITRLSVKSEVGNMSKGSKDKITSLSAKKSGMVLSKHPDGKPNFSK